ncbi:MAG: hypothetical protein JWM92_515 [Candidatus Nomurabacteria bacterium]|nr:hypothetical protein [Candidatus Nomurabacteria bacterium]
MKKYSNKNIYFTFSGAFLLLFILLHCSAVQAQDNSDTHGARHTRSVYDIIQQQPDQSLPDQQTQDQPLPVITPVSPEPATQSPVVTPVITTVKPANPVKKTPTPAPPAPAVVAAPTPYKSVVYDIMQSFIPTDPYIEKGFRPLTTKILYAISGITALSGLILVIGRPRFIARRLAALFTFS